MVLVDASHPDQENRFLVALKNLEGSWLREAEFLEFSMPFGIPRLMKVCDNDPEALAAECNFHHAQTSVAEMRAFAESGAHRGAGRHAPRRALARSRKTATRPSSRSGKTHQLRVGKNARRVTPSLDQTHADNCQ